MPIDLAIGCMRIRRDETGIVQLQPVSATGATNGGAPAGDGATPTNSRDTNVIADRGGGGRDREVLALQLVMQQLKLDNEHLKWQLRMNEKSAENVL